MGMSTTASSIQKGTRRGSANKTTIAIIAAIAILGAGVGAWYVLGSGTTIDIVRIDGSSTVFPITSAWASEFNTPQRQVLVAFSGTGGGFAKFCRGETDLSDASRPMKQSEVDTCTQNGVTGIVEYLVAYDGLSVVVPLTNTWVESLTVSQLCRIWTQNESAGACGGAGGRVTAWNQLNASWPATEIQLYGPGTASGTFDYFVEVILTPFGDKITSDYIGSEDDNVLVQGVANTPSSLGYFGFAYVEENLDKIRALPIDAEQGAGPIAPTHDTIRSGTYAPLSRPLFVYANARSLDRPIVKDFLRFGYAARGIELVDLTGYVSLNATEVAAQLAKIPV